MQNLLGLVAREGGAEGCGLIVGMLVVGGGVGFAIGKGKGRGGFGFVLGALLGLIGWIIIAVMPGVNSAPVMRRRMPPRPVGGPGAGGPGQGGLKACPYCAEMIQPAARICRFCKADV